MGGGFCQGVGKLKEVGGATPGNGGDGVDLFFGDKEDVAEGAEYGFDALGVGVGEFFFGCVGGDACPNAAGGVGHGTDDLPGVGEMVSEFGNGGACEDGEEGFASGQFGDVGVEVVELLGFAGQEDQVSFGGEVGRLFAVVNACELGEGFAGIIVAGATVEVCGWIEFALQ